MNKIILDTKKYPKEHLFTVVKCEQCGCFYEPYEKEHKCKKNLSRAIKNFGKEKINESNDQD